jgi:pimeloyl-ACP methyl ester carboxylesterase
VSPGAAPPTEDVAGVPGVEALRLPGNGVTLHAVAAGPRDGPLLVLLHGFPEFWWSWRRQIGPLAEAGLRVVAPDLRGYNLSDKPSGVAAYALETVAEDIVALAAALGHERFAVAGHDWGAILAWHLAARRPMRISRAAILNGPHPATLLRHMRAHPTQLLRMGYVAAFQLPLLPEALLRARDFAPLAAALKGSARSGTFPPEDLARYREAWRQQGALTAMLNWYRALLRHGPGREWPRIAVPVRVIWGDRDIALDRRLVEAGISRCDRGEAFHLPEATHWVHHEEPERVTRLLLDFVLPGGTAPA